MTKNRSVVTRKGSEIEACPEGDGFKGAWFKAILEGIPKKPARKFKVRFLDLDDEDGSSLRETIFQKFLRPIPPENLFSRDEFEEGSLVEAAHRDGWWVGVFVKKLQDKYLVYFDSPPDLICFKRKQLRQHFDWIKKKWVRPKNKELSKKSKFSCGTVVEVMEEGKDVVWVEAIVVKENEDGESFIIKSYKNLSWNEEMKPKRTVSLSKIRCIPPPMAVESAVESYQLMEPVDVFMDPGWRLGLVIEILCEKQYTVRLEGTEKVSVFKHSDLRPSKETWRFRSLLRDCTQKKAAITSQGSLCPLENGEVAIAEDEAAQEPSLAQGSGNEMADDVRNESSTLDIAATTTKQAEITAQERTPQSKTLEPMQNQNGLGNGSTREMMPEEHNSEKGRHKRKRGEPEHNSNLNVTVPSPDQTTNSAVNVEETYAEDTNMIMVLPFVKKTPAWKMYETMEVPQTPHFSPLLEEDEGFREGCAVGLMVSYCELLERFKGLKTDVSMSQLDSLRGSFTKLEKHGFNVTMMLSRINTLVAFKSRQLTIMEELNRFDKEKTEESIKKRKAEEEFDEVGGKILELQRHQMALEKQKEAVNKKISQVETCARDLGIELMNVENEFEKTLTAPW